MSALADARDRLAALLAGMTVDTTDHGPDPFVPVMVLTSSPESVPTPCVILQPDDPYLDDGGEDGTATFTPGEYAVHFEAWLVVDLVDNAAATNELDAILTQVLERVGPSDWWLGTISQPGPIHTAEWMSHGMRVQVSSWVTL